MSDFIDMMMNIISDAMDMNQNLTYTAFNAQIRNAEKFA